MSRLTSQATNLNAHALLLRTWGELGRRFARSSVPVVRWDAARRMIEAARPQFNALAGELTRLLDESDKRLNPLADPLRMDFGAHRWLNDDREESYSDWLAWIVQNLPLPDVIELFAIKELFPEHPHEIQSCCDIRPKVEREVPVPQGHVDQAGRLDLVIHLESHGLIVVEAKMGNADSSDTAKHRGYAQWLKTRRCTTYPILLATAGEEPEYDTFRLLKWADICPVLWRLACERGIEGPKQNVMFTAMILAFVGAVEQNLLGFSVAAVESFQQGRLVTFDPKPISHLERCVGAKAE